MANVGVIANVSVVPRLLSRTATRLIGGQTVHVPGRHLDARGGLS